MIVCLDSLDTSESKNANKNSALLVYITDDQQICWL